MYSLLKHQVIDKAILLTAFLLLLLPLHVYGQDSPDAAEESAIPSAAKPGAKAEEPIKITSDQMEANNKAGFVIFKGNVVARQNSGIIMSNILTVYYDDQNRMDKIIATGDVRITQEDRVGTCQKATFYPPENKIVMEEGPRLWRDRDIVEGEVITIFTDSDKMFVEGGARVTIRQKDNAKSEGAAKEDTVGDSSDNK